MKKMIIFILIAIIVLGIVIYFCVPIIKNPAPDYYKVQGKTIEIDGPNNYQHRVTLNKYFKGAGLDY